MVQPKEYRPPASTGLEQDWWRTRPDLRDAPLDAHPVFAEHTLGLGGSHGTKISENAGVEALTAWDYRYQITDPKVRQITIDLRAR